jgi:integrase
VPERGRKKTKIDQVSPLTDRAREILMEIKEEKKTGTVISNVNGLVFTQQDARPLNRGHLQAQVKKAVRSGINKLKFHDLRNTALTQWRPEAFRLMR